MKKFDKPKYNCNICGSKEIFLYHKDHNNRSIYKCKSCKIQFLNPQYSDEYLSNFYSKYTKDEPEWDEPLEKCHNYYLSIIEKYSIIRGKLLDIGCGKGHLLSAAKARGWSVEGYDVDSFSAEKIGSKIGVKIHCGDFTKINWCPKKYDVITMHQVIEHLKDPIQYLPIIAAALKDYGILFIALPNINSFSSVTKLALEKAKLKRKRVGAYYDAGHHLFYYTPKTLKFLLARFGFEAIYFRSGYKVRPKQLKLERFLRRNIIERVMWESTFMAITKKIG